MSAPPSTEPTCTASASDTVELIIRGSRRDLGGIALRRLLPAQGRRMIGPFIFFDHVGPSELAPGQGLDVRPHPHIGLVTVTYLFAGSVHHRDSLGMQQVLEPGSLNWMTAGRGIVHSERSSEEFRKSGGKLHGIQLWIALPSKKEETKPSFRHYAATSIPSVRITGVTIKILAGSAFGVRSPVHVLSPLLYAEATMPKDSRLVLPNDLPERAAYVVSGTIRCGKRGDPVGTGQLLVFGEGDKVDLRSPRGAHIMIIAGEPVGPRFIEWNLVSSSQERIEEAKDKWQKRLFPTVPGDEDEFIPLPE
ncbi:MAG TPA: pirin family protein [Nannocystis exedens]|nr:pirin family protein [Nannocystis exedens]